MAAELGATAALPVPIDWNQTAEWDSDNGVAKLTVASGASVTSLPTQDTHIVIEPAVPGGLPLRMLFEPANSGTLVISLHGAMDRGRFRVPRFEWRRTLNRLDAARLYLSDSTLEINGSLEIGWYVGRGDQDLIADYAGVVHQIIAAGGFTQVVCVGSSAGGYGALALSRRIPNSVAVAFSPQTTIGGYHLAQRKAVAAAAFPELTSYEEVEKLHSGRVNVRKLYQKTRPINAVYFVQNTGDQFHYEAHYVPFALANGVDPERGGYAAWSKTHFVAERYENEHAPPSRGNFVSHIQQAHLKFYGRELPLRQLDPEREEELGPR
ncbi:alpha/beta hydrolase [Arthrobacter sp. C9C5]|uniref:alpha/beta hydrolase n=1 Tax=Arthrobacter sp. C9C5 TaxID=2735267 RepID=UPI001584B67F|nr:alpha/beta hydrolase [Arthrobacter sp. C9C5]NUU33225.1 alpha/beta hydrolase [Arthrobacter sp. C9C5]